MNIRQAKAALKKLGFKFLPKHKWGSMEAEPYDVGKDHFKPRYRDVYIGECVNGYYITSHIKGMMRRYRCRREFDTDVGNIFGGGETLEVAITQFVHNFKNKIYNRRDNKVGLSVISCLATDL
jgi:hypothetical protein